MTIPKNALLEPTRITLTPVTRVDGLPFSGGLVAALQMAPEGLRLYPPATLKIETPDLTTPNGMRTVGFAYHQNGSELYLNPIETQGNTLTLTVWHFSGSGAVKGTPAEVDAQRQRVPANPEDRVVQGMQEYLTKQHDRTARGEPVDPLFIFGWLQLCFEKDFWGW